MYSNCVKLRKWHILLSFARQLSRINHTYMGVLSRYSKPLYNSNRNTLEEKIEGVRETGNGEHQETRASKTTAKSSYKLTETEAGITGPARVCTRYLYIAICI